MTPLQKNTINSNNLWNSIRDTHLSVGVLADRPDRYTMGQVEEGITYLERLYKAKINNLRERAVLHR